VLPWLRKLSHWPAAWAIEAAGFPDVTEAGLVEVGPVAADQSVEP
jgi:hypothetical protein